MFFVSVQQDDFDVGAQTARLVAGLPGVGGIGCFIGVVRSDAGRPIQALTLEHYPAMTRPAIETVAGDAVARFGLLGCTVIHRFGRLLPGDRIVLVATAAGHRRAALQGTEYIIDWLKTSAPFWKKEHFASGDAEWVEAAAGDDAAAARW